MRYLFTRRDNPISVEVSHAEGLALQRRFPDGILTLDLEASKPVKRTRRQKSKGDTVSSLLVTTAPSVAPAASLASGPSIAQRAWLSACGQQGGL